MHTVNSPLHWWAFLLLLLAVLGSALGVIHGRHYEREMLSQLQSLEEEWGDLNYEWGRLRLEKSAYTRHVRIEKLAREKFLMQVPAAKEVVLIRLKNGAKKGN